MNLDNIFSNSSLYHQFITIDAQDYRSKIRFYDSHKSAIENLEYQDQLSISLDLVEALFHIGSYHRFLGIIDPIIEAVVEENIYTKDGKDIYIELLFKKAASFYNIKKYKESAAISRQLVRIEDDNKIYRSLYRASLTVDKGRLFKVLQAFGITLFFSAIVITFIELTVVHIFFADYQEEITFMRYTFYGLGVFFMVGNEIFHYLSIRKRVASIRKI